MLDGLLLGDVPGGKQRLHKAVVRRDLVDPAVLAVNQIGAAVADMGHQRPLPMHVGQCRRGAHAAQGVVFANTVDHGQVGRLNGRRQLLADQLLGQAEQAIAAALLADKIRLHSFHRQAAGFFPGDGAPHPIGHQRQHNPLHRPQADGILVVLAQPADICARADTRDQV